jgi:hypothetical protein
MRAKEFIFEISDERLQNYLSRADRHVNNRLSRMGQARERLNKNYEIYDVNNPTKIIARFTADSPDLAREYLYKIIGSHEPGDQDFHFEVRRSTGLSEGRTGSIQDDVAKALPATYSIPELKNQDPYLQYRFSVAIAGAKGAKKRSEDNVPSFTKESPWGENEIVVSYGEDMGDIINDALKAIGMSGKKRLSTVKSEETSDVGTVSPVKAFKGW